MKWSKGWFTLVALAGAAGVAIAMLVPVLVQREMDRQVAARLAAASSAADAQIQLHARRWIDSVSHAALDVQLAEALDHASTGSANLDNLHKTALERLRSFQSDWKAYQAIAVDAHGKVVARVGSASAPAVPNVPNIPNVEDRWKDDLSSAQIVTEALKGFRLDDTWLDDGRLLKVVAAPVVARDRYAGAVLIALDLGAELAQPLADRVGSDVVFLAGGKIVGKSASAPAIDAALPELKQRAAELAKSATRGEPIPLPSDGGAHVLLAAPIAGTAAAQAMVVVVSERPRLATPAAIKARLLASLGQLPWIDLVPVGGGLLATLLLGFFLMGREHSAPLERLQKATQALSRGEVPRLDDSALRGPYASIARFVNAALEKSKGARLTPSIEITAVARAAAAAAASEVSSIAVPAEEPILPPPPNAAPPSPHGGEPAHDSFQAPSYPPAPAYSPGGASFAASPSPAYSPGGPGFAPAPAYSPGSSSFAPSPGFGSSDLPSLDAPLPPPAGGYQPPASAFAPPRPGRPSYTPLDPPLAPSSGSSTLGSLDEISGVHSLGDPRAAYAAAAAMGSSYDPGAFGGANPIIPPEAIAPPAPADPVESEFQSVFQDFIDTRQRCGEPIEGVTFEKFAAKLRGNREQLMGRYNCKGVKFQVYVKDGKAALKATPIT